MNDNLNRRELLQRVAYLMGGAISAPAALAVLNGCTAKREAAWQPLFLTKEQGTLVEQVAEIMIPRTDTPGAKDAGVPAFIDLLLKEVYAQEDRERYVSGLEAFDAAARAAHGQSFVKLNMDQQTALVRKFHNEALDAERAQTPASPGQNRPFILMTKELTLLGFFTSQPGATQVLQYIAVPGAYQGCVPLAQAGNGKAWAYEVSRPF